MKARIMSLLYKLKDLCYTTLRGAFMEKGKDEDLFFKDGPIGLLVEGFLITLVLTIAVLVLMLSGGNIELGIKEIIEALLSG